MTMTKITNDEAYDDSGCDYSVRREYAVRDHGRGADSPVVCARVGRRRRQDRPQNCNVSILFNIYSTTISLL
jgi:hypothetical protein